MRNIVIVCHEKSPGFLYTQLYIMHDFVCFVLKLVKENEGERLSENGNSVRHSSKQ